MAANFTPNFYCNDFLVWEVGLNGKIKIRAK